MMLKHSGPGSHATAGADNEQDYPDFTKVIYMSIILDYTMH